MDIVIELISRSRRVIERHRFTSRSVSIGRAYDNDLIISDPHISPHHAVIRDLDEAGWRIEDLNSKNGIFTRKHQRVENQLTVTSGDEFILGKTHLRFFDRMHTVPEADTMNPVEKVIQPLSKTSNAIVFILIALAIFALDSYLGQFVELEFRRIFMNTMGMLLIGIGWAVVWSFIGRILRHDARFLMQLVIAMAYLLCEIIFSNLVNVLEFNSSSEAAAFVIGTMGHFMLLTSLLWLSLYVAISQSDRRRLLTSFAVSGSVISLALLYYFLNMPDFSPYPEYANKLKPPALQWLHPVNTDTFLKDAGVMFENAHADMGD